MGWARLSISQALVAGYGFAHIPQFMEGGIIALFELTSENGSIRILEEKHYRLVSNKDLTSEDLDSYRKSS